jgi:UDP-glucose 4-epimerase
MIYIDNLSNHIKKLIDDEASGVTFPQNAEYVRTNEIVRLIREYRGKKTYESKLAGWLVRLLSPRAAICRKAYGNLTVGKELSDTDYIIYDFDESVRNSMA